MQLTEEDLGKLGSVVNEDHNPVKYLAIDPGKANGVCGYDAKYYPVFMYTVPADDMVRFLDLFKTVETCVVEGFNLYPNKAKDQFYSDMETSRVIGRVESWAELRHVTIVRQGANIKATGYKWVGTKALPKSNPRNHEMDAHIHFMYWAVRNRKINASDLIKRPVEPFRD